MRPPTSDEQIRFLVNLQRLLDEGAFIKMRGQRSWYRYRRGDFRYTYHASVVESLLTG